MSEEALESGGRSAQKAVSEAGFDEELKRQLEERIASATFRAENRNAFAEAGLPSHAGRGTRDIATADPWTGTESVHDISLRMLNDAHKPLRFKGARTTGVAPPPPRSIDTGRKPRGGLGTRLANARDRSGIYSSLKDSEISEEERQQRFQELKDRFSPNARSIVPGTIQGLASLANERIEDAIARGQFKNLPRGKVIERDYNASNPFLDTTEYFMNKMIQKQDIVPPWIEKQQELVATANKFRSRLRNDWRRHAARMIASAGGTLQEQMQRAEAYAKAELIANPIKKKQETLNTVDESGHVSQISLSGELKVPKVSDGAPVTEEVVAEKTTLGSDATPDSSDSSSTQTVEVPLQAAASTIAPAPHPFRDPSWETTESAYHNLAINDLNSRTRSYNLQAPDLAKKPYYSLARELNACYADVAPQLAEAIKERAMAPKKTASFGEHLAGGGGGVMDRLVGEKVRVRDERIERQYGFRQFWKDVWGKA
jgi:stress response protein YsnF